MANIITVAARSGGGDPEMNFKLRLAIDKARSVNMPADNIERAIKKGAGELSENIQLKELAYEAYGPGGVALIIEAISDNNNRTLAEVKNVLTDNGGRMGEVGSVRWMFDSKGIIRISGAGSDKIEMAAIEAGAEDIEQQNGNLVIVTIANKLSAVKESLVAIGVRVESADIELIPQNPLRVKDKDVLNKIEKLMEALDDLDDVGEVYSNLAD